MILIKMLFQIKGKSINAILIIDGGVL